jgi:alpha-glucoside transport system substrate-binding protein
MFTLLVSTSVFAETTVTVLGANRAEDEARFLAVVEDFMKANPDIKVTYEGTAEFETLINVRVEAGNPPDVASIPQPGLMKKFAADGKLVPAWPELLANIDQNYSPAWKDLGSYDGKVYGVFHRVNGKGFVWYNKPAFEAAGYTVPTTWEELEALTAAMAETDTPPWCVTMESGAATGWVGTDWLENIMLRTQPVDAYDKWISHELLFNSPEVKGAWDVMNTIWADPKLVYGGLSYIGTARWQDAGLNLFEQPQKCQLLLQGSFITAFFPEEVQADLDNQVGVFPLPAIDPGLPSTLEVGGEQYVAFNDRPEVRKFMEFLATGKAATAWVEAGGALFPYKDQDVSLYKSAIDKSIVSALIDVQAARFDASDAMPSEGNVAFWKGVTDYVGGANVDDVLTEIDAAFPQ